MRAMDHLRREHQPTRSGKAARERKRRSRASAPAIQCEARDPGGVMRRHFVAVVASDIKHALLSRERRSGEGAHRDEVLTHAGKTRGDLVKFIMSTGMADQEPRATFHAVIEIEHCMTWRPWRRRRNV